MGEAFTESIKPTMDSVSSGTASLSIPISSTPLAVAPPPRTTLTSLPLELLIPITLYCDHATALSLDLVCRSLTAPAEHRIWQQVNLSLPPYFGQQPHIPPCLPPKRAGGLVTSSNPRYTSWLDQAVQETVAECQGALDAKVSEILLRGQVTIPGSTRPKINMVKALRVMARPSGSQSVLRLIESVAPTLVTLAFECPPDHSYNDPNPDTRTGVWQAADRAGFHSLGSASLSLPFLTHLHVGRLCIPESTFVYRLCGAAPSLVSVDIQTQIYRPTFDSIYNRPFPPQFPLPPLETKIETLRLAFRVADVLHLDVNVQPASLAGTLRLPYTVGMALLKACPQIRRVSIDVYADFIECDRFYTDLTSLFEQHEGPWELHLALQLSMFSAQLEMLNAFHGLRRLVLTFSHWYDTITHIPALSTLETILLIPARFSHPNLSPTLSQPSLPSHPTSQPMDPSLASQLRNCPRLRSIYVLPGVTGEISDTNTDFFTKLDELEFSTTIPALSVISLRHEHGELLLARFLMRYRQISDLPTTQPEPPRYGSHGPDSTYTYKAEDGSWREKTFDEKSQQEWVNFTDYEGLTVPLEVMEEMRAVAGVKETEWKGRGIEVGEEAWKVLMDWRDGPAAGAMEDA